MTGLPPTKAQVDAFVNDKSADAYEKVVDQLLANPHYGERMAVFWLDLVRYADTVGYHGDQEHVIDPYRDYVIQAFNDNLSFDQFTAEQLAGDLEGGQDGGAVRLDDRSAFQDAPNRVLQVGCHRPGLFRCGVAPDGVLLIEDGDADEMLLRAHERPAGTVGWDCSCCRRKRLSSWLAALSASL